VLCTIRPVVYHEDANGEKNAICCIHSGIKGNGKIIPPKSIAILLYIHLNELLSSVKNPSIPIIINPNVVTPIAAHKLTHHNKIDHREAKNVCVIITPTITPPQIAIIIRNILAHITSKSL